MSLTVVASNNTAPQSAESLFDLYFEYAKDTEPPLIYHRWSLIASVGAFLGRQFWFPFGTTRIFPNMYVMLIGNPGTRKSTAIKMARRVVASAGYDKFAAERTTKEKFLLDLEGAPDEPSYYYNADRGRRTTTASDVLKNLKLTSGDDEHDGVPREIFITADEFNEFAGTGNLDFLSTLGALWDWDDEIATYKQRFKNSKSISIFQPTISLLGGNTHSSFKLAFPEQAIGQGFLSRLVLVHSEPSGRKITFPTKPPEEIVSRISGRFAEIRTAVSGECQLTASAKLALDIIYRTWQDLDDYRLKSYSTRRFTHLIKVCLIVTAMRGSTILDRGDVVLANTILAFTEGAMPKALGEFGKSRDSDAAHALMTALYEAANESNPRALSVDDLWKVVSRDLDKRERLADLLSSLHHAGKIQTVPGQKGLFLPIQKPMVSAVGNQYVDIKMLREVEGK
jgi:hypothetical protein